MYSVYEWSTHTGVELYLTAVKNEGIGLRLLQPGLQSLLRDDDFKSLSRSQSLAKQWLRRIELLTQLQSGDRVDRMTSRTIE